MHGLFATALFALFAVTPAHALDQVVTGCGNETDLRDKFEDVQTAGGGKVTFDCGQATITLQNPLTIIAPTTIDGGDQITLSGGGDRRVFVVAAGVEATLESLVLTDGRGATGGAILNDGNLTLRNVAVLMSRGTLDGGAIASSGSLTITDGSILSQNEAVGDGGAILALAGGLTTIVDSEISLNTSNGLDNGVGGGVALFEGSDLVVTSGTITGNTAKRGGAIAAVGAGATISLDASVVSDNDTIDGAGAGILVTAGELTVIDSTLSGNDAINGSGGAVSLTGVASGSIRRSAVYGNSSTMNGGGIAIDASSGFTIQNVTFSQNGALVGGGVHTSESSVTVDHSTFAGNVALAGASFANTAASGALTVRNTIVANPVQAGNCSDDGSETTVSLGGNLSSDASCVALLDQGTDVHETDPMLSEMLEDNGGPTPTYLPLPGSPVLDTGVDSGVATDQRGIARPQGAGFDRGAVEVVECVEVVCGDANGNGSVTASDALAALRTAVGSESCPLTRCDYDDSGEVQSSDALAILRASVGQPTVPACPAPVGCPSTPAFG